MKKRQFTVTFSIPRLLIVAGLVGLLVGGWLLTPATARHQILDLVTPVDATAFWTAVSALATVLLVVLAYRGLRSLGLTKTDMLTRATRDARESAIARCEEFATVILPMNSNNLDKFSTNKVPVFVQNIADVRFDPDNASEVQRARQWLGKLPAELYNDSITLMNRLEGWAMYFTNQLADHQIAFGPCAPPFYQLVLQYYPLVLHCRANPGDGNFPNTVALFKSWNELLEHKALGEARGALLKELARLQAKGGLSHSLRPPLGTQP